MGTSSTTLRVNRDGGLKTRSGRKASQNTFELQSLIEVFRRENVTRYLEIGARHGDTFFEVMRALPESSIGVAVDMPGGNWGHLKSGSHLQASVTELRLKGYDANLVFGNSQLSATKKRVARWAPFDAVLIDGDHLYDGVKRDWQIYRSMARIVVFHDIAGEGQIQQHSKLPVEVPKLWREIKDEFRHEEFIAPDSKMGIGVIWVR